MRSTVIVLILFSLLDTVWPQPVPAAAFPLQMELWCDLAPPVEANAKEAYPPTRKTAIKHLLEEARVVVSAMLYGYTFVYTPADRSRHVSEYFALHPSAEIPWGDRRLLVRDTKVTGTRLRALISYRPADYQEMRRKAWGSGIIPTSSGTGQGNLFLGYTERRTAFEEALKEAVRNYLRPRVPNKPRQIRGELLVWEAPTTYVAAGQYNTTVTVKLRIAEIVPYRVYQ